MFRKMRRQDRMLSEEEAMQIVENGRFGVLSVMGEDGYPYGVPVYYIVDGKSLYFHSTAGGGHKADALKMHPKVSFTVIEMEDDVKGKSVILFGEAVEVPTESRMVLEKMVERSVPQAAWEPAKAGIPYTLENVTAYGLKIRHMTGKRIDKPEGR